MGPDLKELVQNLTWSPSLVGCCQAWLGAGSGRLERLFREWCARNEKLGWMLDTFAGLPEARGASFCCAQRRPTSCWEWKPAGRRPSTSWLANWCACSRDRARKRPPIQTWSKCCARSVMTMATCRAFPSTLIVCFSFRREEAPRPASCCRSMRIARRWRGRVAGALDALEHGNPVALAFVRMLTLRLAIREEANRPEASGSCSFGEFMGLPLLINPLCDESNTAWLIDALVHESIHTALFFCELSQGHLLFDRDPTENLRSPWTDNPLPCHQYVHACFVWFGLAQLWKNWPAADGGIKPEQVADMHRTASSGFANRPVTALLSQEPGQRLQPKVAEALMLLEQLALSA